VGSDQFIECCGIECLYGARGGNGEVFHEVLGHTLVEWECDDRGDGDIFVYNDEYPGLLLYAATDSQKLVIEELKKNKFKALSRFQNPKTGNWITLFGLVLNQLTAKERQKVIKEYKSQTSEAGW
jgi:hypothetical protein